MSNLECHLKVHIARASKSATEKTVVNAIYSATSNSNEYLDGNGLQPTIENQVANTERVAESQAESTDANEFNSSGNSVLPSSIPTILRLQSHISNEIKDIMQLQ